MKMKTVTNQKTKTKTSLFFALLSFVVLSIMALAVPSAALACTAITESDVTAGGYTISSSGDYCLTEDIATNITTGIAIKINVDDVTIDMDGYELDNTAAAGSPVAIGIYANEIDNVTIRNGIIRGYYYAMILDSAPNSGRLVEDMIFSKNSTGIYSRGSDVMVRNNTVLDSDVTGIVISDADGASVINNYVGGLTRSDDAYGIYIIVYSSNVIVRDNRVAEITSTSGIAAGIGVSQTEHSVFENNYVSGLSGTSTTYGFKSHSGIAGNAYIGNHVIDADYGFHCASSTDWMRDNTTTGVTTLRSTCTDKGNNN